jgi:Domain of unknown function (DUF1883)
VQYLHTPLGDRQAGDVVEVTLRGTEANVLLLDSSNLAAYKARRRYRYRGGHYRRSPVRLPVPRTGTWHVVVDLGGYPGSVNASVRVLGRGALAC